VGIRRRFCANYPSVSGHHTMSIEVRATEWNSDGDHPKVSPFENMTMSPTMPCRLCGKAILHHGWLPYEDDGFLIHPGDWIVEVLRYADNRVKPGAIFACRPDIFKVIKKDFMIIDAKPPR